MNKYKETYIVLDVETDGPVPGLNSMLSIGAAALEYQTKPDGRSGWNILGRFGVNLFALPDASADLDTEEFWLRQPAAWKAIQVDKRSPEYAIRSFADWVTGISQRRPTAVGAPAAFDFPFIRYYMLRFLHTNHPFGHSCIDMKSVASEKLKIPYYESGKSSYPREWFKDQFEHNHVAMDDALEQAWIFARMLDWN